MVYKRHFTKSAFTIVELLVVIVVIGILAAISIVSYTGISQKAVASSLQSDLSNASTVLKMYQIDNSAYPNSVTDCPTPSTGNICLKASSGNSYPNYSANNTSNPQTYSLTAINNGQSYTVTNNSKPISLDSLASAPLSPVADWLATPTGDHYGNYYDLVTKKYATVTRATPKTIFDPSTSKIYDVPANYLGVNPRSDGKNGSEGVIEEGRTNYLLSSSFEADGNSDGVSDNWAYWANYPKGTPTSSLVSGSVHGTKAQRIQYTGIASDNYLIFYQGSAVGTFAVGDNATGSVYIKGTVSGTTAAGLMVLAYNSGGTLLNFVQSAPIALTSAYQKVSLTYPNLPATTSYVSLRVISTPMASGDTVDITVDAVQLEKGTFATSYIPTTNTTITRDADVVTVPTSNWNGNASTILGITGPSSNLNDGRIFEWVNAALSNYSLMRTLPASPSLSAIGATVEGGTTTTITGYRVFGLSWAQGAKVTTYNNGIQLNQSAGTCPSFSDGNATAWIGSYNGSYLWNAPIQRLIVYNSVLSSGDVSNVTNVIQNGP